MHKKLLGIMIVIGLMTSAVIPVQAETMEERITALEETVAEQQVLLEQQQEQIEKLQAVVGIDIVDEDVNTETEVEIETEEEAILKTTEEFLEDIKTSFDTRGARTERYTTSELNTMNNDEYVEAFLYFVEAEEPFYEEYKNAHFEDLNIQYLCNTYCTGVKSQLDGCRKYLEDKDFNSWDNTWQAAFNKRAYVIVELSEYYGVRFGDVSSMKEAVASLDSLNEAETRNASIDRETVRKVQELLNTIGFLCGNADGVSGKRTVKSIKRFQEMYGYDPVDGMIDEELIDQLEAIAAEKTENEEVETEN